MMWGGGGGGKVPQQAESPESEASKQERAKKEAESAKLIRKRKGSRAARLTDPILDATNQFVPEIGSDASRRVSLLGGGEYTVGR